MDDAKNQVRAVLPAADVVCVLDRDVEMTGMTAQADESQSKEKPESDEKAGTAVASQDQSAVALQAPIAAEEAPKAEEEQIDSNLMPKEAIENMELDNETLQQQPLRDSLGFKRPLMAFEGTSGAV